MIYFLIPTELYSNAQSSDYDQSLLILLILHKLRSALGMSINLTIRGKAIKDRRY